MSTQLNIKCDWFTGFHGLSSEDEMVRFLMFENDTVNNTRDYLAGVVFTNSFSGNGSSVPKNIVYKLRFSSSPRNAKKQKFGLNPYRMNTNWQTDFIFPLYQQVGPRTPNETCGGPPGLFDICYTCWTLFLLSYEIL